MSATRLRPAAEVCELGDRAVIEPLKRLEEAAGLFVVERNRGKTRRAPPSARHPRPGLLPAEILITTAQGRPSELPPL